MSSCFRIYYSRDTEPLTEQIEAGSLAQAIRVAEARRARSSCLRYFEIWQDANLLFTSEDNPNSENVVAIPQLHADDGRGQPSMRFR